MYYLFFFLIKENNDNNLNDKEMAESLNKAETRPFQCYDILLGILVIKKIFFHLKYCQPKLLFC